jgi:5-formyltetrahydrofolate cyclo-ligase
VALLTPKLGRHVLETRRQLMMAPHGGNAPERNTLRRALRSRRRSVPQAERAAAALRVARHADRVLHLRPGWRIGLYASFREELDTAPLIALARRRGCRIYLPVISPRRLSRGMRFVEMTQAQRLNRLGIAEPEGIPLPGVRYLDVVFLPLVGFDSRGVRLGMGGGYYDRAFAFRRARKVWHAPKLIGLAYTFQQLERIANAPHDVRLDAVVTDRGVIRCSTG